MLKNLTPNQKIALAVTARIVIPVAIIVAGRIWIKRNEEKNTAV